jgi:hypothetical protein
VALHWQRCFVDRIRPSGQGAFDSVAASNHDLLAELDDPVGWKAEIVRRIELAAPDFVLHALAS